MRGLNFFLSGKTSPLLGCRQSKRCQKVFALEMEHQTLSSPELVEGCLRWINKCNSGAHNLSKMVPFEVEGQILGYVDSRHVLDSPAFSVLRDSFCQHSPDRLK